MSQSELNGNPQVYGDLVDRESRCIHYHSELDIISLKCFSCQRYYPCYQCHNAHEDHTFTPYPRSQRTDKVVLCGHCFLEMTISTYESVEVCPSCQHSFNPGCKKHASLYFTE